MTSSARSGASTPRTNAAAVPGRGRSLPSVDADDAPAPASARGRPVRDRGPPPRRGVPARPSARRTRVPVVRQRPPPRAAEERRVRVALVHPDVGDLGSQAAVAAAQPHERGRRVTDAHRADRPPAQEGLDGVAGEPGRPACPTAPGPGRGRRSSRRRRRSPRHRRRRLAPVAGIAPCLGASDGSACSSSMPANASARSSVSHRVSRTVTPAAARRRGRRARARAAVGRPGCARCDAGRRGCRGSWSPCRQCRPPRPSTARTRAGLWTQRQARPVWREPETGDDRSRSVLRHDRRRTVDGSAALVRGEGRCPPPPHDRRDRRDHRRGPGDHPLRHRRRRDRSRAVPGARHRAPRTRPRPRTRPHHHGRDPDDADQDAPAYDGPHDPAYARWLLGASTPARSPCVPIGTVRSARVLRGEQSNTSIICETEDNGTVIVKVFRVLHHGDNPDVTTQQALSAAGSSRVPRVFGALHGEWPDTGREDGVASGHLAFAQEFLPGLDDAWRVALDDARRGESFADGADRLGAALAEVHVTLAGVMPTVPATAGAGRAGPARRCAATRDRRGRGPRGRRARRSRPRRVRARRRRRVARPAAHPRRPAPRPGALRTGAARLGLPRLRGRATPPPGRALAPDVPLRDVAGMLRSFDYVAGALAHETNRSTRPAGRARPARPSSTATRAGSAPTSARTTRSSTRSRSTRPSTKSSTKRATGRPGSASRWPRWSAWRRGPCGRRRGRPDGRPVATLPRASRPSPRVS